MTQKIKQHFPWFCEIGSNFSIVNEQTHMSSLCSLQQASAVLDLGDKERARTFKRKTGLQDLFIEIQDS